MKNFEEPVLIKGEKYYYVVVKYDIVITSYSIHYTKLYEDLESWLMRGKPFYLNRKNYSDLKYYELK